MDDYVEKVTREKPVRGREMRTNIVPTDMFDTMKLVSAKKTNKGNNLVPELTEKSEGTAEHYHVGYINGKMYLVPDSNLEAMHDVIKFKMKPKKSEAKNQHGSYEITDFDMFRGKLKHLLVKVDKNEGSEENVQDDEEEQEEQQEEEQVNEVEENLDENQEENEKEKEEENEEEKVEEEKEEEEEEGKQEEEEEDKEEKMKTMARKDEEARKEKDNGSKMEEEQNEEGFVEEENEEGIQEPSPHHLSIVKPQSQVDSDRLRFLISGHFKKDKEPIYIIQDYRDGPDLFKDQKADFYSNQKEDGINLTMSGRFYDGSILEESQGRPRALNIESFKIMIDEKTSSIYKEYFEHIFQLKSLDILLKGEFIKSKITKKTTPFLKIEVKHKNYTRPDFGEGEDTRHRKSPTTAVLLYKPERNTPFTKGDDDCNAYQAFDTKEVQSNALILQSTI